MHHIKCAVFTIFKWTVQWHQVYSHRGTPTSRSCSSSPATGFLDLGEGGLRVGVAEGGGRARGSWEKAGVPAPPGPPLGISPEGQSGSQRAVPRGLREGSVCGGAGGAGSWARTQGAATSPGWAGARRDRSGSPGQRLWQPLPGEERGPQRRETAKHPPGPAGGSPVARSIQRAEGSGPRAGRGRSRAGKPQVPARAVCVGP